MGDANRVPSAELPKRQQWRPKTIEPNLSVQPFSVPPPTKKHRKLCWQLSFWCFCFFGWDFLLVLFCPRKICRFFPVFGGGGWWFLVGCVVKGFQSPRPHIQNNDNRPTDELRYLIDAPRGCITGIKLGRKIPHLVAGGNWLDSNTVVQALCVGPLGSVKFHTKILPTKPPLIPYTPKKKSGEILPAKKCKGSF